MNRLKFLGRGSAFNVKEGNNSAYFKTYDQLILLDCGESIFERIVTKNILSNDIKEVNVFITHLDSDHCGSLSTFIYYCYYIKKVSINVYFPTMELYNDLKIKGHIEGEDYKFNLLDIDANNFIRSIIVKPIPVIHIKTLNCFGYLIYIENSLIWYSGDCSEVSDVIEEYKIDEIYHDTCLGDYEGNVHTSLKKLCEAFPKDERNKVYCMHLDSDELIKKAKSEGFNVVEVE